MLDGTYSNVWSLKEEFSLLDMQANNPVTKYQQDIRVALSNVWSLK